MKRSTLVRLVIVGVAVAALVLGTSAFVFANGNGAAVAKFEGGFMPAAVSGLSCDLSGGQCINVDTPSGNSIDTCQFDIPEGCEPDKAIKATGFLCGSSGGMTENTFFVASPGGKATLKCIINGSSE